MQVESTRDRSAQPHGRVGIMQVQRRENGRGEGRRPTERQRAARLRYPEATNRGVGARKCVGKQL